MTRDAPRSDDCTVADLLRTAAHRAPTAPAIVGSDTRPVSYDALVGGVAELGHTLAAAGGTPHDRIAMVLPNGPIMATTILGVMAQAAAAPLNPRYTAAELEFALSDLAP